LSLYLHDRARNAAATAVVGADAAALPALRLNDRASGRGDGVGRGRHCERCKCVDCVDSESVMTRRLRSRVRDCWLGEMTKLRCDDVSGVCGYEIRVELTVCAMKVR
jgi:hypothetical protein